MKYWYIVLVHRNADTHLVSFEYQHGFVEGHPGIFAMIASKRHGKTFVVENAIEATKDEYEEGKRAQGV